MWADCSLKGHLRTPYSSDEICDSVNIYMCVRMYVYIIIYLFPLLLRNCASSIFYSCISASLKKKKRETNVFLYHEVMYV